MAWLGSKTARLDRLAAFKPSRGSTIALASAAAAEIHLRLRLHCLRVFIMASIDGPVDLLRFPPFPTPPPGIQIMPFKAFRPSGIRISTDGNDQDDVERDGLGIPTVMLRVKHNTDAQGKKKRKKKGGAPQVTANVGRGKMYFWDDWEEYEDVRKNFYDP